MMNSDQVFDAIEEIAATSSKNAKEELVAKYGQDEMFKRVIVAALDPFITYGMAKRPAAVNFEGARLMFDDLLVFSLLDKLAERELTGNNAIETVQYALSRATEKSAELLWRIISKDLRAGFSESTVNKAIPGLVPTFDCMLAHKYSDHKHKLPFPLLVEPKLDGVRVLTFVNLIEGRVSFFSRSGKEFTTFDHLKEPVLNMVSEYRSELMSQAGDDYDSQGLPDGDDTDTVVMDELYAQYGVDDLLECVIDSEVVSGNFNKTVGDVRRKDEQATDAKLAMFDLLPMETFTKEDKKGCAVAGVYRDRRKKLEAMYAHAAEGAPLMTLPIFTVINEKEIHELYEKVRARGLEGLIIKDPNGLYHRRRNHAWTKIKAEESADVVIVDVEEGTGKYAGMLGALVVDYNGVRVNVGSGLSDEQRREFWEAYKIQHREFGPTSDLDVKLVGRMIEVEYHEVTPDGSLRHPRFKRFRDDKLAA